MSDEWRTGPNRAAAVRRAMAEEDGASLAVRRVLAEILDCPLPGRHPITLDPCGQVRQHVEAAVVVVARARARVVQRDGGIFVRACGLEVLEQLAARRVSLTCFANVPFSASAEWARRLAALAGPTLMVGPCAPGSVYWSEHVWPTADVAFLGREAFVDHRGEEQVGARAEHALVAWRCRQPRLAAPSAVWVKALQSLPRGPRPGRGGADTDAARGRQGQLRRRLADGEHLTADSVAKEFSVSLATAARALQRARRG